MALSIAQMQTSDAVGLPTAKVRLCLAQKLVDQVAELELEKAELEQEKSSLQPASTEDGTKQPARMGDPNQSRIVELDAQIDVLVEKIKVVVEKMRDHTGDLTLQAIEAGQWRQWADAHPPRYADVPEDAPAVISAVDVSGAFGLVNVTALLADLGMFAVAWEGEPLTDGQWDWIATKAAPGDLAEACRKVVKMQQEPGRIPK